MRNDSFLLALFLTLVIVIGSGYIAAEAAKSRTVLVKDANNFTVETRNNSLSLLAELLGDEKNVSKVLIIKHSDKEVHDLIKRISATASDAAKTLEELAKTDSTINLKMSNLPPGEKAARETESKATEKELLHSKGEEFEFNLLMTQAEALNYGSNLAKVASQSEPDSARRQQLVDLSNRLLGLHEEVVHLIRQNTAVAASH